jgi:hypothetical protein
MGLMTFTTPHSHIKNMDYLDAWESHGVGACRHKDVFGLERHCFSVCRLDLDLVGSL